MLFFMFVHHVRILKRRCLEYRLSFGYDCFSNVTHSEVKARIYKSLLLIGLLSVTFLICDYLCQHNLRPNRRNTCHRGHHVRYECNDSFRSLARRQICNRLFADHHCNQLKINCRVSIQMATAYAYSPI